MQVVVDEQSRRFGRICARHVDSPHGTGLLPDIERLSVEHAPFVKVSDASAELPIVDAPWASQNAGELVTPALDTVTLLLSAVPMVAPRSSSIRLDSAQHLPGRR